jgi:membrane associated rhomboid family serine protease
MNLTGLTGIILIGLNILFSYRGFTNPFFFDGYKFEVDKILVNRDYKRLISCGFLHLGWTHLIFNMITLFAFCGALEYDLNPWQFLAIYAGGLLGGNLFCLRVHRQHGDYSAAGASGAVCALIFASIALFPGIEIGFPPLYIPGWLYGIVYVLYSIYGIKSKTGNVGHEAHLGGALVGMMVALLLKPSALAENYLTILLIAIPTIAFICFIISRPQFLLIDHFFYKAHRNDYTIDHQYNLEKKAEQSEIDNILDKISKKGMNALSNKEKETLRRFSQQQK